jgi:hypothetical protein
MASHAQWQYFLKSHVLTQLSSNTAGAVSLKTMLDRLTRLQRCGKLDQDVPALLEKTPRRQQHGNAYQNLNPTKFTNPTAQYSNKTLEGDCTLGIQLQSSVDFRLVTLTCCHGCQHYCGHKFA